MPRRGGWKPPSPARQKAKGETRPSRAVVDLFPDHASRPDPDVIEPPKWLSAAAKKIWREKVERYRQRGQKIAGFEDTLAQYCALEADIRTMWSRKLVPTMAMMNGYRLFAAEFYDTPSSGRSAPSGPRRGANRFAGHGRRP